MKTAIEVLNNSTLTILNNDLEKGILIVMEQYAQQFLSQLEQKDKELEEVKAEVVKCKSALIALDKERKFWYEQKDNHIKAQADEIAHLKASLEGKERDAIGFAEEMSLHHPSFKNYSNVEQNDLLTKYLSSKANQGGEKKEGENE